MKILMVLLVALLLPLNAVAEDEGKENKEEKSLYERYEAIAGESVGRIRYSRTIEWRNVDENALVVETRRGRYWLLDMERGCIRRPPCASVLKVSSESARG